MNEINNMQTTLLIIIIILLYNIHKNTEKK
jgi:hypothetical protein